MSMPPEQLKNLSEAVKTVKENIQRLTPDQKDTVHRAVRDIRKLVKLYGQHGELAIMLVASEDALARGNQ